MRIAVDCGSQKPFGDVKRACFFGLLALVWTAPRPHAGAPPAVGSISQDVVYAEFNGGALVERNLSDNADKIVLLMYTTVW